MVKAAKSIDITMCERRIRMNKIPIRAIWRNVIDKTKPKKAYATPREITIEKEARKVPAKVVPIAYSAMLKCIRRDDHVPDSISL